MTIEELNKIVLETEKEIRPIFEKIEERAYKNSDRVLTAFEKLQISEMCFNQTTGYGYNDYGRDVIDELFAEVLGTESAIARGQIISGTHALTIAHFGVLRPGDVMVAISGMPYDSIRPVIGINENQSSLVAHGVKYEQIDLQGNEFDKTKILERVKTQDIKLITIQKSRGYSTRKSLSVEQINEIIKEIRKINNTAIIMVDNCYGELVEESEPIAADLIVGSLIKNLGGGMASNGGYIAGKKELVDLCAERMTVPGQGREVGPSLGMNKEFLKGMYHAPNVVMSSLKTAIFTARIMEKLGFKVSPRYDEKRTDIVQSIIFEDEENLIKYIQGIQKGSAIDSSSLPIPDDMPGYKDKIIMASGSFVAGSSIELSCDGPIRPPYIAFQQGGLTYEYGKLGVIRAIKNLYDL